MNDAVISLRQARAEQRIFWRNPASAFFGFFFPILFLVIFATIFKSSAICLGGSDVVRGYPGPTGRCPSGSVAAGYSQYFVASMIVFGVISACYTNIAMSMVARRDLGILKRFRGTPLPTWCFLLGVVASSLVLTAILSVLMMAVGRIFYGAPLPHHALAAVVTIAVGALTFCAVGLALTVFIPNQDAAPAIVNGIYFPVVFISGIFFPITISWLNSVAAVFPVKHFLTAVLVAFDPRGNLSSSGWSGGDLAVLGVWAAGSLLLAARRFRWEPRRL